VREVSSVKDSKIRRFNRWQAKCVNPEALQVKCLLCAELIKALGNWVWFTGKSYLLNTDSLHEWHSANVVPIKDEPGGEIIIAGPADSKAGS
jgi:hypothetical protein